MSGQIRQITWMNLRNIGSRLGTSSVIVVGIAGVAAVLIGLLAMANGFSATLSASSNPDRGVLLGRGADNEMNSWLTVDELNAVEQLDEIKFVSGELYVVVDMPKKETKEPSFVVARGVSRGGFEVRPELKIVEGRTFQSGRNELIVGTSAAAEFVGLEVGDRVALRESLWEVVGHFEAAGSSVESEIWLDLPVAQSLFRRSSAASTARILVDRHEDFATAAAHIDADPRLNLRLLTEEEFYADQSSARTALIETFAYGMSGIMALGAMFAALNTMYTAVGSRAVEIATLRAIGFGTVPIVMSVMIEAIFLAIVGGVLGSALVYIFFDGYTMSMLNGASSSQVVFDFAVTPLLVAVGLTWALVLGAVGGFFPAIRAARMPIAVALRGS